MAANASQLEQLCDLADSRRHEPVGDALSYVVNRNLDTAAVAGSGTASRTRLVALVGEAHALGATEICMQGPLPTSSDDAYLDLIGAVTAGGSGVHLHAFRPSELLDGAARHKMPVDQFLAATRRAGLGSVPGTAARILDDEVRARTKGGPDLACLSGSR